MAAAWKEAGATMGACMRPLPAVVGLWGRLRCSADLQQKVSDASGAFAGPVSSPGDGRPCIIDHKTLNAMLFHLWGRS